MARTAIAKTPNVNVDLAADMRAIIGELNLEHFERGVEIETVITTILAGQHGFILGDPGTDKSRMLQNIALRFDGARYRRALMHRQLGEESLFGNYDIPKYDQQGIWERDLDNTLGDADIALIDEPDKAGPASFMPLLTWMNERLVKPGKTWLDAPLISAWGAANALLEEELSAIWDRFLVRFSVDYIKEYDNLIKLMSMAVRPAGPKLTAPRTTVPLDVMRPIIRDVIPTIIIPQGVMENLAQLRFELHAEGVRFSDRRLYQSMPLLQAAAWLAGRDHVADDDLGILVHVYWDVVEQIPLVEQKVLPLISPLTRMALEFRTMLDDVNANIDALKGQELDARASYGGTAGFETQDIQDRLTAAIAQAKTEGRTTHRLEAVQSYVRSTRVRVYIECMNTPPERAEKMVDL